jgi:hypothetical protein
MTEKLLGMSRICSNEPHTYAQNIHTTFDMTEVVKAIRESACNVHVPQAVADVTVNPIVKIDPFEIRLDHTDLIAAIGRIKPVVNVTIEPIRVTPPIINVDHKHPLLWVVLLVQTLAMLGGVALYAAKNY